MKITNYPLRTTLLLAFFTAAIPSFAQNPNLPVAGVGSPLELKSPDGKVALHFALKDIGKEKSCPVYAVSFAGQSVLVDSRLGLCLRDLTYTHNFKLIGQKLRFSDTTWKPVTGERATIRDNYHELTVELQMEKSAPFARKLNVTFRAYNEGVAFAYTVPEDEVTSHMVDILAENTQFAFAADYTAWPVYHAQADYTKSQTTLGKIKPGAEYPLTVRLNDHLYAAITTARIADYARIKFQRAADSPTTLEVLLDGWVNRDGVVAAGEVLGEAPFTTSWRVVMIADSPGKLLEQNYLVLNLNDPCALADTSWIKPGKVIRSGDLSTAGGKACIDFAAKHNLQYIEYDAGWYGTEWKTTSDARAVAPALQDKLNLPDVVAYGNSKGIGVILYVNQHAMEYQLDEFLPIYEKWGIKGVKYGFVNVGSQYWAAKTHEAIRKAAAHHLMVDIHDEFRNCGYQRTYPNLMTVEGIGGDETRPTAVHDATLPFTRFLTGPADHTYCWNPKNILNTKAHQLATTTINFSAWQFLYWYDSPNNIPDEPALDYWDQLPTSWDETRVLQADIGRRVVVARRSGSEWFVGAIAPVDGKFPIALDFLPAGKKFTAKIFADEPNGTEKPDVKITEQTVDSQSVLNADIPSNGGMAIRLSPL